jgi:hypothetical protein
MSVILIKGDTQSNKLLKELAKKLGASVLLLNDNQFEELALGALMDQEKTGELVSKDAVLKKLKGNCSRI